MFIYHFKGVYNWGPKVKKKKCNNTSKEEIKSTVNDWKEIKIINDKISKSHL